MSIVLLVSIFLRLVALIYATVVTIEHRDWRLGFLALAVAMMLARQLLTLWSTLASEAGVLYGFPAELPGLFVSFMALASIYFLSQLLTEQRENIGSISLYKRIVDDSLNEIYVFDGKSLKFIEANPSAQRNLGYDLEELKQMTPVDIKPEYTSDDFEGLVTPILFNKEEEVVFETVHRRKDKTEYDAEVHLQYLSDKEIFFAIIMDITERKQAVEALKNSEGYLRAVINGINDPVYVKNKDYEYVIANEALCRYVDRSPEDFFGKSDSQIFSAELSEAFSNQDEQVLDHGESLISDEKMVLNSGLHLVSVSKSRFINPTTGNLNLVGVLRDITEQRYTEEALRAAQKMEAIGQLAGGIAHDFNNILGIILGNLELLRSQSSLEEKATGHVEAINKAVSRATILTRQLLGTSRAKLNQMVVTDINKSIEGMDELLARSLTPKIVLENHLTKNLWKTKVDIGDFEDALLNLAINARDAMPDGGNFVLETHNRQLDEEFCRNIPDIVPGNYVQLIVADSGEGMPQDILERIYEPFFTTKLKDKGTGLGLAMVFGFIKRSAGHIEAESDLHLGTTFYLYFPEAPSDEGSTSAVEEA